MKKLVVCLVSGILLITETVKSKEIIFKECHFDDPTIKSFQKDVFEKWDVILNTNDKNIKIIQIWAEGYAGPKIQISDWVLDYLDQNYARGSRQIPPAIKLTLVIDLKKKTYTEYISHSSGRSSEISFRCK
jgi:hypothetical protein